MKHLTGNLVVAVISGLFFLAPSGAAMTQSDPLAAKGDIVANFALKICGNVPLYSDSRTGQASAAADAESKNLLKQFVDAGVHVNAGGSISRFNGVLQKDLPTAIHDNIACRIRMAEDMMKEVFPAQAAVAPKYKLCQIDPRTIPAGMPAPPPGVQAFCTTRGELGPVGSSCICIDPRTNMPNAGGAVVPSNTPSPLPPWAH